MNPRPAEFLTEFQALDITEGRATHTLRLVAPLTVYSGVLDAVVTVPQGFEFDGESIPAFLR